MQQTMRIESNHAGHPTAPSERHAARRAVCRSSFQRAYEQLVLGARFVETTDYYRQQRVRYRRTLEHLARLDLPRPADILEVGGGQVALLAQALFGDRGTVGDLSEAYAEALIRHGLPFVRCDLLRDRLPPEPSFDAIVLCEVVEHLPTPLHLVLERLLPALRPGGLLFVTTPNLHRLRNLVRLLRGREIFTPFFHPEPGQGVGHVFEFSAPHLRWQLERAGLEDVQIRFEQLVNRGSSRSAEALRRLSAPLLSIRPLWRDNLVAWGRKPLHDQTEGRAAFRRHN